MSFTTNSGTVATAGRCSTAPRVCENCAFVTGFGALTTTGPDALIKDLARGLDPARHGEVLLHFYPFGGLRRTAEWVRDFRQAEGF